MKLKLQRVRISFAQGLFVPQALEPGQTPKYGADFLLVPGCRVLRVHDDKSTTPIAPTDALVAVANATWKGKGVEMLRQLESSKKCLREGDRKGEKYPDYAGLLYFTAKHKRQPALYDRDKSPITSDNGRIYSGCYVTAIIELYGVVDPKKRGVFASLLGVQFVEDGEAFAGSGSRADENDFDDLSAGADAPADVSASSAVAGLL